jgi:hypothetical protein
MNWRFEALAVIRCSLTRLAREGKGEADMQVPLAHMSKRLFMRTEHGRVQSVMAKSGGMS